MYYIVESNKSFDQAATDLEAAVKRHEFGVLHIHDLGNTLRGKGVAFAENCKVFEVCNPGQAASAWYRHAFEHGPAVPYLGLHRTGKNHDRNDPAGVHAWGFVPGCIAGQCGSRS